jgi:hypothetical protein
MPCSSPERNHSKVVIEEEEKHPVDCQDELGSRNGMMRVDEERHAQVQRGTIRRW